MHKNYSKPIQMAYNAFKPNSSNQLSYNETFQKLCPVIIMHGLLGSKRNWKSLGTIISEKTGRTIYTVDARNHGDSSFTNKMSYSDMAADIIEFMKNQSIFQAILVGHSMGGRSVMKCALENAESDKIEKLFVLDMSPIVREDSMYVIPMFLNVMKNAKISPTLSLSNGRNLVDKMLLPIAPDKVMRNFLLANLVKDDSDGGKFLWKANLDSISNNFHSNITKFDIEIGKSYNGETHFIGGGKSDYIRLSDHGEIRKYFPNSHFSYIENAGHWLHFEQPTQFINLITRLINH